MVTNDNSETVVFRLPVSVVKKIKKIAVKTDTTEDQVVAILLMIANIDLNKKTKKSNKDKVQTDMTPSEKE
jgi:hypothetical protein